MTASKMRASMPAVTVRCLLRILWFTNELMFCPPLARTKNSSAVKPSAMSKRSTSASGRAHLLRRHDRSESWELSAWRGFGRMSPARSPNPPRGVQPTPPCAPRAPGAHAAVSAYRFSLPAERQTTVMTTMAPLGVQGTGRLRLTKGAKAWRRSAAGDPDTYRRQVLRRQYCMQLQQVCAGPTSAACCSPLSKFR